MGKPLGPLIGIWGLLLSQPLVAMSRITQLDAVNSILAAAGSPPVNTVESPTTQDAASALALLNDSVRQLCQASWDFNTDYEVTLEVTLGTGNIDIPDSYVSVTVPDMPWVVLRGSKMYDRDSQSYVFETALDATVVRVAEWDELPEVAKTFATKYAAVRFYRGYRGNDPTLRGLELEAAMAQVALNTHEAETARYNLFDSADMYASRLHRGHRFLPPTSFGGNGWPTNRTPK